MGSLSPMHWLIIVLVFVLLFGSKRLPDAAKSLGKSLKIFKNEIIENDKEDVSKDQIELNSSKDDVEKNKNL